MILKRIFKVCLPFQEVAGKDGTVKEADVVSEDVLLKVFIAVFSDDEVVLEELNCLPVLLCGGCSVTDTDIVSLFTHTQNGILSLPL